jgi:hypothetical protein
MFMLETIKMALRVERVMRKVKELRNTLPKREDCVRSGSSLMTKVAMNSK